MSRYQYPQLTDAQAQRALDDPEYKASLEARWAKDKEVFDAVSTLVSNALNRDAGLDGLRQALRTEHSTLLGKLANEVLAEIDQRKGDGRLCNFHATVGEYADRGPSVRSLRISEIRQSLI